MAASAATCGLLDSCLHRLNGRASHGAVTTKDATISRLGPQHDAAVAAWIKGDAGIGGHCLSCLVSAMRTRDVGAEFWGKGYLRKSWHLGSPQGHDVAIKLWLVLRHDHCGEHEDGSNTKDDEGLRSRFAAKRYYPTEQD
jgi:hypothetical protein